MKKLWLATMISAVALLILSGCGSKGISAEEAGELFVNRLVYQKEKGNFAKEFQSGEQLGQELDDTIQTFEEKFSQSLNTTGAEIPQKQAQQVSQELQKQAKEKTTYKIVEVDEKGTAATITYYVTGLDLVSAVQEMTRELVKETLSNSEISEDDQKTIEATFNILKERVKVIKVKADPVEFKLHLKKEKGQWYLPEKNKEEAINFYITFISGAKNIDAMNDELEDAMNEVAQEIIDSLDTPAVSKSE
ncbi:DUF5105 domain-containing protein [Erwinia sp. CPCC 100877]|nr:DUF5105 domain-containing protein [Erwinia sp. CPCC 100877]